MSSELLLCFSYLSHEKGATVIDLNDEHAIKIASCLTREAKIPYHELASATKGVGQKDALSQSRDRTLCQAARIQGVLVTVQLQAS